jgi:hypothetical protein
MSIVNIQDDDNIIKKCNICKKGRTIDFFKSDEKECNECNICLTEMLKCDKCKKDRLYMFFMDTDGNEMAKCAQCKLKHENGGKKSKVELTINGKIYKNCNKCAFFGHIDNFMGDRGKHISICLICQKAKQKGDKASKERNFIKPKTETIEGVKHKNCNKCKKMFPIENFKKKKLKRILKLCEECRDRERKQQIAKPNKHKNEKCPCGKKKVYCVEHGGGDLCEHKERKNRCKICIGPEYGNSLCDIHKREKSSCVKCGGGCPHGKATPSICRKCGGSAFCKKHKTTIRTECVPCKGSYVCIHEKLKWNCDECNGNSRCVHKRCRYSCKECNGNGICEHDGKKFKKAKCAIYNPNGHLKHVTGRRIRNALKTKKTKLTIEYLDCYIEFYREYLSNKFEDGMSWEIMENGKFTLS